MHKCWDPTTRKFLAVKDTSIDVSRGLSEVDLLKEAASHGLTGIPRLHVHWEVKTNKVLDSTAWLRTWDEEDQPGISKVEVRVHHRLVLDPYVVPFREFLSKRELLAVLHNGITGVFSVFRLPSCD